MRIPALAVGALATLSMSALAAAQPPSPAEKHVTHAATSTFEAFPNMPTCFKGAVLRGDPQTGPSVFLVKSSGACRVPRHWHTPTEQLMIVSGTARMVMKGHPVETLRAGSFAHVPARHQHEFSCPGACTFFVTSDGAFDIHYVDDDGKEIPFEQAVKAAGKPAARKP